MSILIPNMKLPNSCADCELVVFIDSNDMGAFHRERFCPLLRQQMSVYGKMESHLRLQRAQDCPLQEVEDE